MDFYVLAAIAEAIIVVGSGIDARWRPVAQRRLWLARWFWWHIAPFWLAWLLAIEGLMASAEHWAAHGTQRYEVRRTTAPLLVAKDSRPFAD